MSLRSCHGCARCKRRRQKCDEAKPHCLRCVQAEATCEYLVILKWDGRVPRRPETLRRKREKPTEPTDSIKTLQPQQQLEVSGIETSRRQAHRVPNVYQLDVFNSWTPAQRLLWDHYMNTASMIASHKQLRDQICHQILPMAMQIPSLMYGTLAFSALHRLTLLNGVPDRFIPEAMISDLMSKSLKHLREELQSNDPYSRHLLLHTIRTLCVSEIYSGKADSSWRIHADGARAILCSVQCLVGHHRNNDDGHLTSSWYSSMEAMAALTTRGILNYGGSEGEDLDINNVVANLQDYCLDFYTGYSSDLNNVFKAIGILAKKRQSMRLLNTLESGERFECRVVNLENTLRDMIRRDAEHGLKIPPGVSLPKDELKQFDACNVAYQYSALLHIHRRLQKKSTSSPEIQASVRKILDVVASILPMEALSPWALLTTPIFTAGCEALQKDRVLVRNLLLKLYETLRIRNILRAIDILEARWARPTENHDHEPDNDSMDFIPY